ncbi:AI-2E family transporter [Micrococcus lacusdianchii]|uniref:AI-2E family transporter n=1 Tax=Micrococcus lacusdianchii TaxID=2915940 RepID=UPI0020054FA5|nr:AI-2E family transporter [uncultured Micrococcus sp.]
MSASASSADAGPSSSGGVSAPVSDWDIRRPHRMWPRMLVIVLTLAGLVVVVQFVQGISQIVAPVFLGLNLVIVAYPLQSWLIRRGVHPVLGAAATVLLVCSVLAVVVGMLLWSALELITALPEYAAQFERIVQDVVAWLGTMGVTPDMVNSRLAQIDLQAVSGAAVTALTTIATNIYAVVGLLATVIMGMFFLAMDSMAVERRVDLLNTARHELGRALLDFAHGVRRYWIVTTVFGLIVAVLDVVALMAIGVPMVLVWGVLSFLTNYIPNIGFVIGLIPPALLGLMEGGWGAFLGVVVSYSVLNFVLQSIIQPKVAGDAVGVVPTVSFLSLLFWAWVLGPLGAILALPCTLLVKAVLIDADPGSRWVNSLIASDLKGMEMRQSSLLALLRRPKDVVGSHAAGEDADAGSVSLDAAAQERVRLAAREAEREGGPSSPLMSPRVDGVSPPEPERGTPGAAGGAAGR